MLQKLSTADDGQRYVTMCCGEQLGIDRTEMSFSHHTKLRRAKNL
jgi:hypothetical protein